VQESPDHANPGYPSRPRYLEREFTLRYGTDPISYVGGFRRMPTVFLSYSRADLPLIEQLEAQLTGHPEISIWCDQEKIYGGQK
jgi:hypothetical protein